jgi:hypothetical protein
MGFRGFPPIRQKNANGRGTELVQEQAVRDLVYRLRNDYTGNACLARWILRRISSPLAFQV